MIFIYFFLNFYNCFLFLENYDSKIITNINSISINTFGEYKFQGISNCFLEVKLWGAGGGSIGGYGGFSKGIMQIKKNQNYTLWVGEGGKATSTTGLYGSFGGGGLVGKTQSSNVFIGTGGGLTGLFLNEVFQNNSILIAGGGGGGSYYLYYGGNITGGNGGGLIGENGSPLRLSGCEGKGGTQTNGGERGTGGCWNYGSTAGSALNGGIGASSITQTYSGGSGGGGYYGGGGGGNGNYAGGPGGGGSGFFNMSYIINGSSNYFESNIDHVNNAGYPNYPGLAVFKFISFSYDFTPKKKKNFFFKLQILFNKFLILLIFIKMK